MLQNAKDSTILGFFSWVLSFAVFLLKLRK